MRSGDTFVCDIRVTFNGKTPSAFADEMIEAGQRLIDAGRALKGTEVAPGVAELTRLHAAFERELDAIQARVEAAEPSKC